MQFYGKRKITLIFFNYNSAFFCLFSLSSNAACSSIPCTMNSKMVVLFKDGFILLMYKNWGRKKLYTNFTNRVYVPLSDTKKRVICSVLKNYYTIIIYFSEMLSHNLMLPSYNITHNQHPKSAILKKIIRVKLRCMECKPVWEESKLKCKSCGYLFTYQM